MDEITKTRLKIFLSLLGVALAVFLLIWGLTPGRSSSIADDKSALKEPLAEVIPPKLIGTGFIKYTKNTVIGDIKSVPYSNKVKSGILVDMDTGRVLWAKSPRIALPIASVTKVMTTLVALEDMKRNPAITLNSRVVMSPTAARITEGGLRVPAGTEFTLEDLFKAMMIGSKNDAATLTAEYFCGGVEADFVSRMNDYAKKMGLSKTVFYNAHGLPSKLGDNCSTAEEVLAFSKEALTPQILQWSSMSSAVIGDGKVTIVGTNHLIGRRRVLGMDGLKTGYTRKARSCLVFTCQRNGKRILGVLLGVDGSNNRDNFCAGLINWAYERIDKVK